MPRIPIDAPVPLNTFTLREAAHEIGRSPRTIYRLVDRGSLNPLDLKRTGGAVRFRVRDVMRLKALATRTAKRGGR